MNKPTTHILSEQGAEINRPSTLSVEVDGAGEEITAVRVGGQAVLVAEGVVRFQRMSALPPEADNLRDRNGLR